MNKFKRNIVLVGFNFQEIRSIKIPPIGKNYYVDNIESAKNHQGFLIIINNKDNIDLITFDKKYRKILNKYAYIWVYNENYHETFNKWSRIETKNRELFLCDEFYFYDMYDNYKYFINNKKENKFTIRRSNNVNKIYNYLKNYKTIKTIKIVDDLKISSRNVQRYMHDINIIYNNIGYDYSNNEWYII